MPSPDRHRVRARAPHQALQDRDPRQRLLPARASAHARRRARDDRQHHRRAADHRLRARHRRRVHRRSASTRRCRMSATIEAHDLSCRRGRGPARSPSRASTITSNTSTSGRGPISSRIRRSGARRRARTRPSSGRRIPTANISICRTSIRSARRVKYLNYYREVAQTRYGYDATRRTQLGFGAPGLRRRHRRAGDERGARPLEFLFNKIVQDAARHVLPAGLHVSPRRMRQIVTAKSSIMAAHKTIENLVEQGVVIIGSPDTVRKQITDCHRQLGFSNLRALLHFGSLLGQAHGEEHPPLRQGDCCRRCGARRSAICRIRAAEGQGGGCRHGDVARPRAAVPAKAGTHEHRVSGIWVPACAGTAQGSEASTTPSKRSARP